MQLSRCMPSSPMTSGPQLSEFIPCDLQAKNNPGLSRGCSSCRVVSRTSASPQSRLGSCPQGECGYEVRRGVARTGRLAIQDVRVEGDEDAHPVVTANGIRLEVIRIVRGDRVGSVVAGVKGYTVRGVATCAAIRSNGASHIDQRIALFLTSHRVNDTVSTRLQIDNTLLIDERRTHEPGPVKHTA